jgi:hypothetical protein
MKLLTNLLPLPQRYKKGEFDPANHLILQHGKLHLEWPDLLNIKATVDYNVFGKKLGALYLSRNASVAPTFVFGWELEGVHVYDLARTLPTFFDSWISGLKSGFPPHLSWKIHVGTRQTSTARTAELSDLLIDCENEAIAQLLCDDIARVQELTRAGKRCERFIHLYCYYWGAKDKTLGDSEDAVETGIREAFMLFSDFRGWFSGAKAKKDAERIEEIFRHGYYQGHQATHNALSGTWGITATPMSHDALWANLRARFSGEEPGTSPYKIQCTINKRGVFLSEEIAQTHIANALVRDGAIELAEQGVSIKRWNPETESMETDHIAVLEARQKFSGWAHEFHQAKGLWDTFAIEDVEGVEYFVDISPGSVKVQRENAQDMHRQSVKRAEQYAKQGEFSAEADNALKESKQIMAEFFSGDRPLRIAFVALIHRPSINELDLAVREFQSYFKLCPLERENKIAGRIWLQTLPCKQELMLQVRIRILEMGYPMPQLDIDFRHTYNTKQAFGMLPFARTLPNDLSGIELVARDKQPIYVDLFSHRRQPHWAIVAKQRVGKSYFANQISDRAIAEGQPVTWIDMPPDGNDSSSLEDRCILQDGSHVDCRRKSFNILGIPAALLLDTSVLTPSQRADRFKSLQGFWLELLMILGGPTGEEKQLVQVTRELLGLAIDIFLAEPEIQQRYFAAVTDGFGSDAWGQTPTLHDFVKFTKRYKIQHHLQNIKGAVDEALDLIDLRLSRKADPSTTIGAAIARPSTVDIEHTLLTVFSLRGLEPGSEESLAYCAGAYASAIQKSLSYPISHVIVEEAQKAAEEPGVVKMMSDIITRYGKAGVRLGLITNSFDKVAQSQAGRDLLDNITTKFVGPITEASLGGLSQTLNIPMEMIEKCASPAFYTKTKTGRSNWLLVDNGRHTICSFHPGWVSAALSASNSNERASRRKFMAAISDKYTAIAAFTLYFRYCCEREQIVQTLSDSQIQEYEKQCLLV